MSKKRIWISLLLLPTVAMAQDGEVAPKPIDSVPLLASPALSPAGDALPLADTSAGAMRPKVGDEATSNNALSNIAAKDATPETLIAAPGQETGTNDASQEKLASATLEKPVLDDKVTSAQESQSALTGLADSRDRAVKFLVDGGPSIWAISALSVITVALILWKIWRLALIGAWSRGRAGKAIQVYQQGRVAEALSIVKKRRGIRSKVVSAALEAVNHLPEDRAREETARVAKRELASASSGLRALELIATIAPLLGLLGTVLGMIAAFQALQDAGNRADPAVLAGGIWEALLTTAAGMAVAIPAAASLTWFESVVERIRRDVEDGATVIFVRQAPQDDIRIAAE